VLKFRRMDYKEKRKVTQPSVFLSYAQKDSESAESLEQGLRVRFVLAWRDKTSLHAGEKWPKALGEAIQRSEPWSYFGLQPLPTQIS
jgi:hypothetical protein